MPVPRWRFVAIGTLGLVLSTVGWFGFASVQDSRAEAQRAVAVAHAEARDADLQTLDGNEGRALGWLVRYRCETGQIRDPQLCTAADKITR